MRAVRVNEGRVEVVDVAAPSGDGIRVRVRSAGICGSDLHILSGPFAPAATLGHEMAGVTDDGTEVAIEPLLPCGSCEYCASGDYNLCRLGPRILIGVGHDGGMADELRVPERCLVPLPARLEARNACLVEPLAVAVHGMLRAQLRGDQRVAVIGGGSIGQCALAVAQASGAETALLARHPHQLEVAERLGAAALGADYDVVIDCAGSTSALEKGVELVKPGGTLLLLATYWEGMTLPGIALCMKEVKIVPAAMYGRRGVGRDIDLAAALLAARPELAELLITHRFPLDAAPEAFAAAADRKAGAIKVVLEP